MVGVFFHIEVLMAASLPLWRLFPFHICTRILGLLVGTPVVFFIGEAAVFIPCFFCYRMYSVPLVHVMNLISTKSGS